MSDFILLLVGALLAIVGGAISDELRAWRDRHRERKAIMVGLSDELQDVEQTIENMHQVWEQAELLPPTYVRAISQGMSTYENLRPRFFLIKDKDLRKEVGGFYRKLKDLTSRTEGRLGTLADSEEAKKEQADFHSNFQALSSNAKSLREKLNGK